MEGHKARLRKAEQQWGRELEAPETETQKGEPRAGAGQGGKGLSDLGAGSEVEE